MERFQLGCIPSVPNSDFGSDGSKNKVLVGGENQTSFENNANSLTEISVFPNPFLDGVEVFIPSGYGNSIDLEVTNALGQVVHKIQLATNDSEKTKLYVPLAKIPPGSYYFTFVSNSKRTVTKKLIKIDY